MLGKILFILYIIFLVYFLFLSDWYGREGVMDEYHYNLVLFKEIKRFIKYRHQLGMQLITKVGCFDVDDILLNTIGGVLGYIVFVVCNLLRRRNDRKKRKEKR